MGLFLLSWKHISTVTGSGGFALLGIRGVDHVDARGLSHCDAHRAKGEVNGAGFLMHGPARAGNGLTVRVRPRRAE